jgi:uncharacterized protein
MGKSQYTIQFGGLPVGLHEFEFEVNDSFFARIENSEVASANISVNAMLTKQNNLLQMQFEIQGTVAIDCDRCLKNFDLPIEASESLVIKHGNPSESTDEILVIPEGVDEVDMAQYLYEYIIMAIPARRVPCEIDETQFSCDYDVLKKLEDLSSDDSAADTNNNPIWEKLNKIKFNKN